MRNFASTNESIIVQNLGKRFRRYHRERPNTLQEAIVKGLRGIRSKDYLWVLRDVSFRVTAGRMLGVIGSNGAGKSTLLRLIGGVGRADEGKIQVHGRIGALLDLGAGFHPDLTGRENVFINGVICGLTRREVAQRFSEIVAFAELEEFIDQPLRTYSTGMRMRLAFAVAIHIEPDILLIDEVLAVGDIAFQRKCLSKIAQFKAQGCTIVFVSHDVSSIQQLCDEVLWLRKGQMVAHGAANVVAGQYVAEMTAETKRRTPKSPPILHTPTDAKLRVNENRFGSLEMEILTMRLLDIQGLPITELESGAALCIEIEYLAPSPIKAPIFGVTISREDNVICYDTNTQTAALTMPTIHNRGRISLQLERLDLNGGTYYVDVGIYEQDWSYAYDYHWHVYPLLVRSNGAPKGILHPPHTWQLEEVTVTSSISRVNL